MKPIKKFDLEFRGYWAEADAAGLPADPGVLCAFARDHAPAPGGKGPGPTRILRITACSSARDAADRDRASGGLSRLLIAGERLAYSFAPLLFGRDQASAAMIYRFKPIGNLDDKYRFRFDPVEITLRGEIGSLRSPFVSPDPEDKDVSRLMERLGLSRIA